MKRIIIILISVVFAVLGASAQSASGRYVSRMTQDGILYFIEPKKITKVENIQRFNYDMTLISWSDSTTVNFTFKSKTPAYPDSLSFKSCGASYKITNYSLLFTDIVKGGYEIRVTSKVDNNTLEKLFMCPEPPIFSFFQNGLPCTATYTSRAWKSDQKKLLDIFNLYKLRK